MFKPKVTIRKPIYDKIKTATEMLGSASVEEFVERTLESEADRIINQSASGNVSAEEVDKISSKLKGLGYLE